MPSLSHGFFHIDGRTRRRWRGDRSRLGRGLASALGLRLGVDVLVVDSHQFGLFFLTLLERLDSLVLDTAKESLVLELAIGFGGLWRRCARTIGKAKFAILASHLAFEVVEHTRRHIIGQLAVVDVVASSAILETQNVHECTNGDAAREKDVLSRLAQLFHQMMLVAEVHAIGVVLELLQQILVVLCRSFIEEMQS